MKQVSRFHLIKHAYIGIEQTDDFVGMGIAALNNKRNIIKTIFAFNLSRADDIVFLLLCFVKPTEEQTRTLCLLPAIVATHVEQNIWIFAKEFLNNTNDRLSNFLVAGRSDMGSIRQIKPIDQIEGIVFFVERNEICYIVVCFEIQTSIFLYDIIGGNGINGINIEAIHCLNPFKVIVTGLRGFFFSALPFCIPFLSLFLAFCLNLASAFHQCKEILTSPFWGIVICFHTHCFNNFTAKIQIKIE